MCDFARVILPRFALFVLAGVCFVGDAFGRQTLTFDLNRTLSPWTWSGSSNLGNGTIVGNPSNEFELDGTLNLVLSGGAWPIATGQFVTGGDALVTPDLHGRIPDQVPTDPDVGTVDVTNVHFEFLSDPFPIAQDGTFTDVPLRVRALNGSLNVTIPPIPTVQQGMATEESPPELASGIIVQTPDGVHLDFAIANATFSFDVTIGSPPFAINVNGALVLSGNVDADHAMSPSTLPFCFGDLASCPCGNAGAPDSGCEISQGTGGVRLDLAVQQTSPQNRVTWTGSGLPAMSTPTCIVIRAAGLDTAAPAVFGDGLRCIGVPLVRLAATFASGGTVNHNHGHGAMAGTGTFYYQLWFRNTPIMFCDPAAAFNLSNGRTLIW